MIRILLGIVFLLMVGFTTIYYLMRDRFPGYKVDLLIENNTQGPLQAGFAKIPITPEVPDRWTDTNDDAQFDQEDGDTYEDGNGNGVFDPVWIAGFQNKRPANGIHDTLWARAMVIDDGKTRLALASLDLIGYGADDIIAIKKGLPESADISYSIITSTHTHEGPDLIGMWGGSEFESGLDPVYRKFVQEQTAKAILEAVDNLQPTVIRLAKDLTGGEDLVMDTRKPIVTDPGIRIMQAVHPETGATQGLLFAWANHPETLWDRNLLLSSDFPHYVREGLEQGVYYSDSLAAPGVGGIAVYVNGCIGGLMTTVPEYGIADPFIDTVYVEPSFDKARAQGQRLAILGLNALKDSVQIHEMEKGAIQLSAKTFEMPLDNELYRLAAVLGIIDRGTSSWLKIRSEVSYWKLGPAGFLHQPGEIYPEIVNGGVEKAPGGDFDITPIETPPLRSLMNDQYKFVVGLSNDMIGYIIPKSEWDREPPYIYQEPEAPYGEINSVGPETGPIIYKQLVEVLSDLNKK